LTAGKRFCLLGGGITSPDNQVCDVEVFIRNYLTGHEFLRAVGLFDHVFPVGWIPDDFGHSPQLPVLLEAMGMKAAGLSRIPGSPQPAPCPSQQLADATVREQGVTFHWTARDGSKVLTQFMPQTYYGLTNYSTTDTVSAMQQFLQQHGTDAWPEGIIFVTQGGDWQFPTTDATVNCGTCTGGYNWESAIGATVTGGGVTAHSVLGTFADYFARLMQDKQQIPSSTLYAGNYYTGYFASRPRLKIDHYHASRRLVGAEIIASLLAMYGGDSLNIDGLRRAIADGWHLLVPTSHHDFVTGTSPDSVHTQHYTLDVGRHVRSASTGYPLRTALYAHTKLHAGAGR
jgi:alpha-mannosidase